LGEGIQIAVSPSPIMSAVVKVDRRNDPVSRGSIQQSSGCFAEVTHKAPATAPFYSAAEAIRSLDGAALRVATYKQTDHKLAAAALPSHRVPAAVGRSTEQNPTFVAATTARSGKT